MIASKKLIGLIAAALMMGAVVGCGGNGSNPTPNPTGPISLNGGISGDVGSSDTTIPASAVQQTATLTVNGSTLTNVTVAPNAVAAPPGTKLAVFPANVPIIESLDRSAHRAPGDIIINGQTIAGVTVNDQGRLSNPLAFTPGHYVIQVDGPWNLRSGDRVLNVGEFVITFDVNADGVSSFPEDITGQLPPNGGSTFDQQSFASFTVNNAFANGSATLTIVKANGNLSKTVDVPGTSATFNDIFAGGGNPNIPANGVDQVIFTYTP
jgi:hypothetical protein